MTTPQSKAQPRYKTWAAWVLVALLNPLTAASCGLLYSVYLHVTTGKMNTVAKGFGRTSQSISFVDSPFVFSVFLVLNALLAASIIALTIVCAKVARRQLWPRTKT